ncbi:MAG: hypothetical protein GC185_07560 [Alphaproteobacteria bacterium]|nr:hypothetical protein [Alphaproteobacteria bacterium]
MAANPYFHAPVKPGPQTVNSPRDYEGNTYLHELCSRGAPVELVREAVEELGADINAFNKKNITPLGAAILRGETEIVECLLEMGAGLYLPTAQGGFFNATYLAASSGKAGALQAVLKHDGGLYVNEPGIDHDGTDRRMFALQAAVKEAHYGLVGPLVAAGAFVNEKSGYGNETPLLAAVEKNEPAAVRRLIEAGADIEQRAGSGNRTPLLAAASAGRTAVVKLLLEMGADPDAANANGETPLMLAVLDNNAHAVADLLAAGANPNLHEKERGETALMLAARKGSPDIVRMLMRGGANPLLTDKFNNTAQRHVPSYDYSDLREKLAEAENRALQKHFEDSYRKFRP